VVASAVGGIPDQVRHDEEGVLVPPDDPDALVGALGSLLEDPARACRLGETGRRRTENEFSYDALVRRIEAVYHIALGEETARTPPGNPRSRAPSEV
jgi:glycosyltransferase involved in cell wall biosynthesis